MSGWIGVDLDGTLAEYGGWQGPEHIGTPVPRMANRVRAWLEAGRDVRIFTDRKDFGMVELWDDRCVQVIANTGLRADGAP